MFLAICAHSFHHQLQSYIQRVDIIQIHPCFNQIKVEIHQSSYFPKTLGSSGTVVT